MLEPDTSAIQPSPSSPVPAPSPAPAPAPAAVGNLQLILLEALRVAYASTGAGQYLAVYEQMRGMMGQRSGQGQPAGATGVERPAAPASPPDPPRIRVVCATREDREGFFSSTALGRSLSLYRPPAVEVRLFPRNTLGLPTVYNTALAEAANEQVVMLFVHDDVHLCDFHWAQSLRNALNAFDIVGLVGNRRRLPRQSAWLFTDEKHTMDKRTHLSGRIAHGPGYPPKIIDDFGPAGQSVLLLDGVFLAARSETLRARSLRFDERFQFHFYDLDFCRQAEQAGLTMGTWPISVVHESTGGFQGDGWRHGYESYLEKWGD